MTQVAGRSGRRNKRGKVIVQTGDPDHWVIQKVIGHDFADFYKSEIIERKHYFYPPFYKVIGLTLKHKDEALLNRASHDLAQAMKAVFKERVLGPESPVVRRIHNYYLKSIVLKVERAAADKKVKERLQLIIDEFLSVPQNKSVRVSVNVDPA